MLLTELYELIILNSRSLEPNTEDIKSVLNRGRCLRFILLHNQLVLVCQPYVLKTNIIFGFYTLHKMDSNAIDDSKIFYLLSNGLKTNLFKVS